MRCQLVEPHRGYHVKCRNRHIEPVTINNTLHRVDTFHFTNTRLQVATGYVLMRLPRLQNRLLPYNTLALYRTRVVTGIGNIPPSGEQLNREFALVFNGNPVREHIMILTGAGICRLIFRFHTYLYALCYGLDHHLQKYHFFLFLRMATKNQMATVIKLEESWKQHLEFEFEKPYFQQLINFVKAEYQTTQVYPPGKEIFHAFDLCRLPDVRVVILGQDPYHGPGQANGLCFSVREGLTFPPSLLNIFKEIKADLGRPIPTSGNLDRWARQGVLLLNATLTVRKSEPGSHQNKGWEVFTDEVIRLVSTLREHVVFMLWGAYAQKKGAVIDGSRHLVLSSPHPSPFSADRGFFGSRHFSKANAYLEQHGLKPINW